MLRKLEQNHIVRIFSCVSEISDDVITLQAVARYCGGGTLKARLLQEIQHSVPLQVSCFFFFFFFSFLALFFCFSYSSFFFFFFQGVFIDLSDSHILCLGVLSLFPLVVTDANTALGRIGCTHIHTANSFSTAVSAHTACCAWRSQDI
jgi:hypothetical protein